MDKEDLCDYLIDHIMVFDPVWWDILEREESVQAKKYTYEELAEALTCKFERLAHTGHANNTLDTAFATATLNGVPVTENSTHADKDTQGEPHEE